jgi:hypothetical protein
MADSEGIVFRLPKALWNKCLGKPKLSTTVSSQNSMDISSDGVNCKHNELKTSCKYCSNDNLNQQTNLNQINKGRKRQNSVDEKLTSENVMIFMTRMISDLSESIIFNYIPSSEYEKLVTGVSTLTFLELANHIIGLRVEFVQRLIRPIIQKLMSHPKNAEIFNSPVDAEALKLNDYYIKIKKPMDLRTVKTRLLVGQYHNIHDAISDIMLVFQNAILYNPVNHIVHESAKLLLNEFNEDVRSLNEKLTKEVSYYYF